MTRAANSLTWRGLISGGTGHPVVLAGSLTKKTTLLPQMCKWNAFTIDSSCSRLQPWRHMRKGKVFPTVNREHRVYP
jgi:hypothetical protein